MAPGPFGLDPAIWVFLRLVIAIALALALVFNGALAQIYMERKIQAIIQDRTGPMHTGPWGLLQTRSLTRSSSWARRTSARS